MNTVTMMDSRIINKSPKTNEREKQICIIEVLDVEVEQC